MNTAKGELIYFQSKIQQKNFLKFLKPPPHLFPIRTSHVYVSFIFIAYMKHFIKQHDDDSKNNILVVVVVYKLCEEEVKIIKNKRE